MLIAGIIEGLVQTEPIYTMPVICCIQAIAFTDAGRRGKTGSEVNSMTSHGLVDMILKIPVLNIILLLAAVLSVEIVGDRGVRFLVNHAGENGGRKRFHPFPFHVSEATREG